MKPLRTLFATLVLLMPAPALRAAISITDPPVLETFDTRPLLAGGSWATMAVGAGGTIQTTDPFDAKVIADTDAAAINTELGSSASIPPTTNGIARWNEGTNTVPAGISFLQTRPTGVDYLLLKATLVNATAGPLSAVKVSYDYSKATHTAGEDIPGLRAFWSTSGSLGSWTLIPNLSIDPGAAATYADPLPVSATITLPAPLDVGSTLFIIWADQNSTAAADASYHIDNFAASPGLNCSITGTVSATTRSAGADPADPADDSVSFTVNVTGTGEISPAGWMVTAPASIAGQTGGYGTDTPLTVPVSSFTGGQVQITVADASTPACTTMLSVTTTRVIGTNTAGNRPILTAAPVTSAWTVDDATRTSTQNSAPQADHVIDSEVIDLTGLGAVSLTVDLDAIAGASSGFETADSFTVQAIIDGGTPVSILGSADRDQSGRLANVTGPPAFVELPDAVDTTLNYSFLYIIPAGANTLQIRIIGNSNSPSETYVVKNVNLSPAPPSLFAIPAGPATVDNKGTDEASDDEFSGPVSITPIDLGLSPGWRSDEATPRTGLYATPNPITFGPYLVSDGPQTIVLTDDLAPGITSQPIVISPPVRQLTVSAPTAIVRNANNPGPLDDTVSFDVTITGANGGPRWTAAGATPAVGNFGTVTFTVPAGPGILAGSVVISDISYPDTMRTVAVPFSDFYFIIGQKNTGGGLTDIVSQLVTPPDNAWVNDPAARTLTMIDGDVTAAGVKTVTSETMDLSGVSGALQFTAVLETRDTSSGFEDPDTFKAELILDDGVSPVTVNLITPFDADLSGLLEDDELADAGTAADPNIRILNLSAPIPDNILLATLVISGINDSGSETMIVRDVLLSLAPASVDSDGDGATDVDEVIANTNINDPNDVFRLSQSAGNPNQMEFRAKPGRYYRVYVSDDADEPSHLTKWLDAGLGTFTANDAIVSFNIVVTPGEPRRFYRVHVMITDGPWPGSVP